MTDQSKNMQETSGEAGEEPTISGEQSSAPEPWAPEGVEKIGVPPVNGEGGERGTSAYDGDGPTDERGPLSGTEYHEHDGATPVGTGTTEHSLSSATAGE